MKFFHHYQYRLLASNGTSKVVAIQADQAMLYTFLQVPDLTKMVTFVWWEGHTHGKAE